MPEEEKRQKIDRLGHYEVLEELGHGGMAWVFRARDDRTERIVAVKVLMPELTAQPAFIKRFYREIDTLRSLQHDAVVKILDVGQQDLYHYYVMEYMDGASLDTLMRSRPRMPAAEALNFIRAIANALQHAHGDGIIHRDIKPANIMTDSAGNVKLADFGIAKDVEATRLTVTGGIVGTADYMSPEQAEGKRVTRKSDLYSLGVVMYEMLTGKVPFTGQTYLDVIRAHRYSLPESPKLLNPAIPGKVARLVESMMEKDPDKRPASAAAVIAEIDAIGNVSHELTPQERETATELVRWALFPTADWKIYLLRSVLAVLLIAGSIAAGLGIRYRYFTPAEHKFGLAMEAFRERRYEDAAKYFNQVTYFHDDSPLAKTARDQLNMIRHYQRKQAVKERNGDGVGNGVDGTDLYANAVNLLDAGRRDEAVQWLELLAADYGDTEGGKKAAAKLAELKGDDEATDASPLEEDAATVREPVSAGP